MNIVVLDGYTLNPGDLSWDGLENLGTVTVYDRTSEAEIPQRIDAAEVVLTNKTALTKATLAICQQIKYIGVLATGYNVVNVAAATELGITVTNIPTYGTAAVSQFAIALLMELCHRIGDHSESVLSGDWADNPDWCYWNYPLLELSGKTMGIIGFGKIGQRTGHIAQALGMKVLATDLYRQPELESETCHYVTQDELFAAADVIVLHCPLFSTTRGIINAKNIAKMKDGVLIINNSRGQQSRQGRGGGGRCGIHRADQTEQPAAPGQKHDHHTAYFVGTPGKPTAADGHCRGQSGLLLKR